MLKLLLRLLSAFTINEKLLLSYEKDMKPMSLESTIGVIDFFFRYIIKT